MTLEDALNKHNLKESDLPDSFQEQIQALQGPLKTELANLKKAHEKDPEDEEAKVAYDEALEDYQAAYDELLEAITDFGEAEPAATEATQPKAQDGGQPAGQDAGQSTTQKAAPAASEGGQTTEEATQQPAAATAQATPVKEEEKSDNTGWWILGAVVVAGLTFGAVQLWKKGK